MQPNSSVLDSCYPSLTLWGCTDSSLPGAQPPAPWEMARLGVQAGHFLGMHTRRPKSSPLRPYGVPEGTEGRVRDGWICYRGWRRIVGRPSPQARNPVDPSVVVRRLTSSHNTGALASGLRQLIDDAARALRYPDDLPAGVAITLGAPQVVGDDWWGHVIRGWLSTVTDTRTSSLPVTPLPLPGPPTGSRARYLREAMEWLAEQPGLAEVRAAFLQDEPDPALEAVGVLGYDHPGLTGREQRIVLARLLSLYSAALTHGCRDQEVIDLVTRLRAETGQDAHPAR
ncbi:hypothetical protein ACH4A3_29495 [Streptomyces sp. NPDC018007]|uniref:hypothetical protein n=1 Tax=Streptomyces sp. NPDC018007 TaxID=3365029 RepID=UPI0037B2BACF